MDSTARKDANKSREKLDLNVKSVIVITLEIAKEEFIYEKGICKNPEGYTWNKTYYYFKDLSYLK